MPTSEELADEINCQAEKLIWLARDLNMGEPYLGGPHLIFSDTEKTVLLTSITFTSRELAERTYQSTDKVNNLAKQLKLGNWSLELSKKRAFNLEERTEFFLESNFDPTIRGVESLDKQRDRITVTHRTKGRIAKRDYISLRRAIKAHGGDRAVWEKRLEEGNCRGVCINDRPYVLVDDAEKYSETHKKGETRSSLANSAEKLNVSPATLDRKIKDGTIASRQHTQGGIYFTDEDIDDIVNNAVVKPRKKKNKEEEKPKKKHPREAYYNQLVYVLTKCDIENPIFMELENELTIACKGSADSRPENKKFYLAASVGEGDLTTYRDSIKSMRINKRTDPLLLAYVIMLKRMDK